MAPPYFYLSVPKIDGLINDNKPSIGQYLTRKQANFVYKKTESGEIMNIETLQQELEHERQLNKIDDVSGGRYKSLQRNDSKQCRKDRTIVSANGTVFHFKQHNPLCTI